MGAALSLDPTPQIRYALTHRPAAGDGIDIVLDLFRGGERALTRTVASVRPHELAPVILACRRYLDRRGARPVRPATPAAARVSPPAAAPGLAADATPVAAFDCLFAV